MVEPLPDPASLYSGIAPVPPPASLPEYGQELWQAAQTCIWRKLPPVGEAGYGYSAAAIMEDGNAFFRDLAVFKDLCSPAKILTLLRSLAAPAVDDLANRAGPMSEDHKDRRIRRLEDLVVGLDDAKKFAGYNALARQFSASRLALLVTAHVEAEGITEVRGGCVQSASNTPAAHDKQCMADAKTALQFIRDEERNKFLERLRESDPGRHAACCTAMRDLREVARSEQSSLKTQHYGGTRICPKCNRMHPALTDCPPTP